MLVIPTFPFLNLKLLVLDLYRGLVGSEKHLHDHSDEGARLLFQFRSGTHEELGRHSDRDDRGECTLCVRSGRV